MINTCSWDARTHVWSPQYNGKMGHSLIGFRCNSTLVQNDMFYDVYCKYDSSLSYGTNIRRREESTMMCFSADKDSNNQYERVKF